MFFRVPDPVDQSPYQARTIYLFRVVAPRSVTFTTVHSNKDTLHDRIRYGFLSKVSNNIKELNNHKTKKETKRINDNLQ